MSHLVVLVILRSCIRAFLVSPFVCLSPFTASSHATSASFGGSISEGFDGWFRVALQRNLTISTESVNFTTFFGCPGFSLFFLHDYTALGGLSSFTAMHVTDSSAIDSLLLNFAS